MVTAPKVISGPIVEPVSFDEVYQHVKIDPLDDGTEESLQIAEVERMIRASRWYLEQSTGRTIHEQTLEIAMDSWPSSPIFLPRATPLIEISGVRYYDTSGVPATVDPSDYIADTFTVPGRLVKAHGASWPTASLYPSNPIRVTYRAGIETVSPVTGADAGGEWKLPILILVAGMWAIRESEVVTDLKTIEAVSLRWHLDKFVSEMMVHC
jgi:uncharacterized phiE125 gp8 family phage protein